MITSKKVAALMANQNFMKGLHMTKYEDNGFITKATNDKIQIEIPISNLVCAFENSPDNIGDEGYLKIKRGKRKEFANFIAKNLLNECDSENGVTFISNAFDGVFNLLFEGYETGDEFIREVSEDNFE